MHTQPDYGSGVYRGSGRLTDKVALVTGGDSGIGRAVAVAFAREGASVAITYLPAEEEDALKTIAEIEESGVNALALPGDLSDHDEYCAQLVSQVVEEFGTLDILVNNAAEQTCFTDIADITVEHFARMYHVNVIAPFMLARDAVKVMRPGSSIINTVSVQAYDPSMLLLPYAASKGALVALTKAMAEDLVEKGVRVNAVAPGPIWTPLNTHGSPVKKLQKFGENTVFQRPGQPVELSPVYVLLASDEASYITGEIYGVTGGRGIA